ncbi:hypothetical protein BCR34DRAFT_604104 [Clohesyomyces aquaticus]|uniref:DH domain-containing protein n=1 Tax=Clohesyomyces aquaticus TaxID=1231657 RepID=A0A1Y1Z9P9_9PLEO|nr:hypothetical protein BCR34DRAFT_604104 [Clohesyomyces aquaticus]
MEPLTAAVGLMAMIPQCMQSAKDLYDLRAHYKDASLLISAIYSESMVIAASLSQVQTLLQRDALRNRPELHDTFDKALTGCRVVYVCLEEEVRELARKADNEELRRRDRLKYLWREETFKELLQQIRGQQSALVLLIQVLQMESLTDIQRLIEKNGAKLNQIATRSKSLRESHPNIRVPQSVFEQDSEDLTCVDAQSILSSADFTFDDEVVNSKAYRRVMALANFQAGSGKTGEVIEGDLIDLNTLHEDDGAEPHLIPGTATDLKSLGLATATSPAGDGADGSHENGEEDAIAQDDDLLDSLERDLLPFMPPMSTGASKATLTSPSAHQSHFVVPASSKTVGAISTDPASKGETIEEAPPPLPPRRATSAMSDDSSTTFTGVGRSSSEDTSSTTSLPSLFSTVSATSSRTFPDTSTARSMSFASIQRKALPKTPISRKASYDIFRTLSADTDEFIRIASSEDVDMHETWVSLIASERKFIELMTKFQTVFYDSIAKQWPVLEPHISSLAIFSEIAAMHQQLLLSPMDSKISQASFATCNPAIFENWVGKVNKRYREYAQRLPHVESAVQLTLNMDPKFSLFIDGLGLSLIWFAKSWKDYLALPFTQLDIYIEKLERLIGLTSSSTTPASKDEEPRLRRALENVELLRLTCAHLKEEGKKREELQSLHRRIHTLDATHLSRLGLSDPGRQVLFQGDMAIKIQGEGSWQPVNVVLLDNFLLWGKSKAPKAKSRENKQTPGGSLWVLEPPIAISDLEINLPNKDNQFQRATLLDDIPRGSVVYQLFVRDRRDTNFPHTLGAYTWAERKKWYDQLITAMASLAALTSV